MARPAEKCGPTIIRPPKTPPRTMRDPRERPAFTMPRVRTAANPSILHENLEN
jgi:hypothetical protein